MDRSFRNRLMAVLGMKILVVCKLCRIKKCACPTAEKMDENEELKVFKDIIIS
jgi:hypothetical protein